MSREHPDHDTLSTADLVAGTERHETAGREQLAQQRFDEAGRPHQPLQHQQGFAPQQQGWREEQPMPQPDAAMRQHQQENQEHLPHAMHGHQPAAGQQPMEQLAALFPPQIAADFRARWDQVQIGFVDDPRQAVRHADELVAEMMKSLASSFAEQRSQLEASIGGEQPDTEHLRMALRSYRSFFQRLLSL